MYSSRTADFIVDPVGNRVSLDNFNIIDVDPVIPPGGVPIKSSFWVHPAAAQYAMSGGNYVTSDPYGVLATDPRKVSSAAYYPPSPDGKRVAKGGDKVKPQPVSVKDHPESPDYEPAKKSKKTVSWLSNHSPSPSEIERQHGRSSHRSGTTTGSHDKGSASTSSKKEEGHHAADKHTPRPVHTPTKTRAQSPVTGHASTKKSTTSTRRPSSPVPASRSPVTSHTSAENSTSRKADWTQKLKEQLRELSGSELREIIMHECLSNKNQAYKKVIAFLKDIQSKKHDKSELVNFGIFLQYLCPVELESIVVYICESGKESDDIKDSVQLLLDCMKDRKYLNRVMY